jgi:two-component system cell cycle sensor histidine kinase/response regulator CckA
VTVTTGGAEALERFAGGLEVDLVILDMNMPGMNGAETLERLLAIRPDQIVMMCSGHWEEQMARLTERPNVLSLQKPFTLDEFAAKLESVGLKC